MNPILRTRRATPVLLAMSLLVGASGTASAATPPASMRLSVEEARERALVAAPRLRQLDAGIAAAAAVRRGSLAASRPQLDATAGFTRRSDVPDFVLVQPGQPPRTLFPNLPNEYRSRVAASLPLATGGRLRALEQAAAAELAAARTERRGAEPEIAFEAESAYWSLVEARATERVLAASVLTFEAHVRDVDHRERAGLAAANERLQVQVERDQAELARLAMTTRAEVAAESLRRLLDLAPGTALEPTEAPQRPAAPPADVEPLVAEALAQRAEPAALAERSRAAAARIDAAQATSRPQLAANAGWELLNPNRRYSPPSASWRGGWDVGVTASWTLYDSGRVRAASAEAQARRDALEAARLDVERRIALDVRQQALSLRTALAAIDVAGAAVGAARENVRVATERHRAGVATSSDRLDAETALLRATLAETSAVIDARLADAALRRALGR